MSKLSKFFKHPKMFFEDAKINRKAREMAAVNPAPVAKPAPALKPPPATKIPPAATNNQANKKPVVAKKTAAPDKNTNMTRDDDLALAKKLLGFELIYPINNVATSHRLIHDGNLHLWPFFRHMFWVKSRAFYKGIDPTKVVTTKMYISSEWRRHYTAVANVRYIEDLAEEQCDFLFFTNLRGTEQTKIDGKIYNRITDPVFEIASKIGEARKIELVKSTGTVAGNRSRCHPVDLLFPPPVRKVGYYELLHIPENFVPQVQRFLPEIKLDTGQLRNELEFFFHQRDLYVDILKKYNPKVVFFVGFDYHYALILAAKSLGIKSVDLQHGVQAGWSPVYNHWQALPADGYAMLPDYFWVWGKYDETKIRENFPIASVKPITGGFPWLDRQQDFFSKQDKKISHIIRNANKHHLTGIITLQDQQEFPPLFKEIVDSTAEQIKWLVKRHPKHLTLKIPSLPGAVDYGKHVDEASFAALLKATDLHLTECSTSVIDADYFGVPSVVTGQQGMANYGDFIDRNQVFHINSAQEFLDKLPDILANKGAPKMDVVDNNGTAERALYGLLGRRWDIERSCRKTILTAKK